MTPSRIFTSLFAILLLSHSAISAQGPQKKDLRGIENYTRVDATVGCAGATTADAVPEIKREGYVAIINFRRDSERGANIAEDITISPNGGRVIFFRNVASVTMDLDDVESVDFRALGGTDNIVVGDLSGTDLTPSSKICRAVSRGSYGGLTAPRRARPAKLAS